MTVAVPIMVGEGAVELSFAELGRLMPMFVLVDARGRIRALGPTLARVLGQDNVIGTSFRRHFILRRTRDMSLREQLLAKGRRLRLSLVNDPDCGLRGSAVAFDAKGQGQVLVNLSFGIHLAAAVRKFGLTEADFAGTDLAMEMLYLIEAKHAVLAELTALTRRLDEARHAAESQALTDPLTGLANRRAFDEALNRALRNRAVHGEEFALVHVDLDFFKQVNDRLGHAAGDAVLIGAAEALSAEVRRGDLVARVGGDEFMLLLRGMTERAKMTELAQRIIARVEAPRRVDGQECRISASIGVAFSASYAVPEMDVMLADADLALYRSKNLGRGRVSVHEP